MENEKFTTEDDRRHSFFMIDNEIIDSLQLCPVGVCMYNCMARYSNKGNLYFSVSKFCKEFRVGKPKALKIFNELLEMELFEITGKTNKNARRLRLKPVKGNDRFHIEPRPVSYKTDTGSIQNPNNTNKQDLINNTKKSTPEKSGLHNYITKCFYDFYTEYSNGKKYSFAKKDWGQIELIDLRLTKDFKGTEQKEFDERFEVFKRVIYNKRQAGGYLKPEPAIFNSEFNNLIEQPTFEITLEDLEKQGLRR